MRICRTWFPLLRHAAILALLAGLAVVRAAVAQPDVPREPDPGATPAVNSIETIIQDMTLPHEDRPHGLPDSCNWARHPRLGMGADPKSFKALTAWGQVYEDAAGNPAANTRVHIRNLRAFILSKRDGRWHRVQDTGQIAGAAFREDFARNDNVPAAIRVENGGGISVQAGGGRNFHFWPATSRAAIDPQDIAGVFVTVQARLVLDDPARPDDRGQARYLLDVGGDYWRSRNSFWFFWKTNRDIAIGRFKYVRPTWQAFNMTTLSADELRRNPPPLE